MKLFRVAITSVGLVCAVFGAPWVVALCIVVLAVRFRSLEAIMLGVLLDMLWLPHSTLVLSFPLCTIISICIVWGFEPLRQELLT